MQTQIGIDYTSAIHQTAGIGRYTREMVRALTHLPAGQLNAAYRLFVASAGPNFARPRPGPGCSWHATRLTERWLARLWFRLHLPLPVERWTGPLHLFHAPDFFLPPVRRHTRTLVTIHDLSFVREPASVMPGMALPLNSRVPRSVARATHVIAVSEATRQDLIELYQTPPDKISVLHHGVGPEFHPISNPARRRAVREKYSLGDAPFVLSVGTIQPRKNYQRLIQAFAHLSRDLTLVIAGGFGWDTAAIMQEVATQKLAGRVHFPGFIDDADLPALYSAAELFVYPSLYEGFGLPALEAMACGTPVVAANRSALPEVVGSAGLLADPFSVDDLTAAMQQLLTDSTLYHQLTAAGRQRAAHFTWPAMAAQLAHLYRRLLAQPADPLTH